MSMKDLFFSIFATDKTGTAFGSVNRRLRETDGLAATLDQRVGRAGRSMQRFGVMGSIASAGIASLFRGNLELYDEQARAEAKVAQAVKATGGASGFTAAQLKSQAQEMQKLTRFGDEEILNKVTAQFLTFKNISGDVFSDAQIAAADLATVLDGDLQSASIMLGKALNDPAVGLSAMSRAGVTFTKDQQDVIKSLQETGDIAGAQRLILDEIASAYGGQAEAARKSGTGMVQAWKNTWGDIKEEVGGVMIDLLPPILEGLGSAADAFRGLTPEGKKFAVIAGAIGLALPPVIGALGFMVTGLAALASPIGLAVAAIAGVTAGVAYFWPEIKTAYEWLNDKLAPAFEFVGGVIETLTPYLTAFADVHLSAIKVAAGLVGDAFVILKDVGIGAFGILGEGITFLSEAFDTIKPVLTTIAEVHMAAFELAGQAVGDKVIWLKDTVASAFTAIPDYVLNMTNKVSEYLGAKLTGVIDKVGEKVEWVERKFFWLYDKVVGNSWVPDLVDEIGQSFSLLDGNMVKPTNAATGAVNSDFKGLMTDVGGRLSDLATSGKLTWKSFMGSLLDVGKSYADKIIGDVFGRLSDGIGDSLSQTFSGGGSGGGGSAGGGLFGGLFGGVSDWLGGLMGFSTGGAGVVTGKAGNDRNVVSMKLSEGERFNVTKRGEAQGGGNVTVNIMTQDVHSFQHSRAQVGGQIARAVQAGQRAS